MRGSGVWGALGGGGGLGPPFGVQRGAFLFFSFSPDLKNTHPLEGPWASLEASLGALGALGRLLFFRVWFGLASQC